MAGLTTTGAHTIAAGCSLVSMKTVALKMAGIAAVPGHPKTALLVGLRRRKSSRGVVRGRARSGSGTE